MKKTIEIPLEYYQILSAVALDKLAELDAQLCVPEKPVDLVGSVMLARLMRWQAWHEQAEELGLTRL